MARPQKGTKSCQWSASLAQARHKKKHTHTYICWKKEMRATPNALANNCKNQTNKPKQNLCKKHWKLKLSCTLLQCVWSYMVIISLCTTFTKFTCAGADEDVADGGSCNVDKNLNTKALVTRDDIVQIPWMPGPTLTQPLVTTDDMVQPPGIPGSTLPCLYVTTFWTALSCGVVWI